MITIVIPYLNRAAYLPETLASLPNDVPIILVDNGSTDNSALICQQFAASHPLVQCTQHPDGGASAARNAGLALVQTEWVYFFDSDDIFDRAFLPTLRPQLTADIDMLCLCTQMEKNGRLQTRAFRSTADPAAQILTSHLATQSMIFRTAWLRSIGGWNEAVGVWDDWVLGLRALLHQPRLRWYTAEAWHCIRVHNNSLTGRCFSAQPEAHFKALAEAEEEICHATEAQRINPQQSHRLNKALIYRRAILCGLLSREGYPARERIWSPQCHKKNIAPLLLYYYTRIGGRGAWRLAMWAI